MKTRINQNIFLDPQCLGGPKDGQGVKITVNQYNYAETVSDRPPPEMLELFEFINRLSHPRINNLILKALVIASRKFPTYKEAADWLGVSPRMFTEYISSGKPFSFAGKGEHSLAQLLEDGSQNRHET